MFIDERTKHALKLDAIKDPENDFEASVRIALDLPHLTGQEFEAAERVALALLEKHKAEINPVNS